jgi:hypothetical protein
VEAPLPRFDGLNLLVRKRRVTRSCGGRRASVGDFDVYHGTLVRMKKSEDAISIERIQTGVRIEKGLLKVLKALAELKDMSLGDLLEGIVLHTFEGKAPFSPATLEQIDQFRKIYGVTLRATDSHRLKERK